MEHSSSKMEPSSDCESDLLVLGMLPGEEVATVFRFFAMIISSSIIFAWHETKCRRQMRIFFLHWASGLVYISTHQFLSVMILLCWGSSKAAPLMYIVKFLEVASLNVWSLSSVAVAVLIASIVRAFDRCKRVPPTIGSPKVLSTVVVFSILLAGCSMISWRTFALSGSYIWLMPDDNPHNKQWIDVSYVLTQLVAGFSMSIILVYLLTPPRRASLWLCCKTNDRVYYYMLLTIFGTIVYVLNAMCVFLYEILGGIGNGYGGIIFKIGWCLKYVHVIADTFILMTALLNHHNREKGSGASIDSRDGTRLHFRGLRWGGSSRTSGEGTHTDVSPNDASVASEKSQLPVNAEITCPTSLVNSSNAGDIESLTLKEGYPTTLGNGKDGEATSGEK